MFIIVWVYLSIYLSIYPSLISTDNSTRFNLPQDGLPSRDDWLQCFESMIFSGINLNREPIDGCVPLPEGQGLSWGGYKWLESQIYFPKKMFSSTMLVQKKMLFRDQPPGKDLGASKSAVLISSRDGRAALVWPQFWLLALSWTLGRATPRACWDPCTMCWIVAGLFRSMPLALNWFKTFLAQNGIKCQPFIGHPFLYLHKFWHNTWFGNSQAVRWLWMPPRSRWAFEIFSSATKAVNGNRPTICSWRWGFPASSRSNKLLESTQVSGVRRRDCETPSLSFMWPLGWQRSTGWMKIVWSHFWTWYKAQLRRLGRWLPPTLIGWSGKNQRFQVTRWNRPGGACQHHRECPLAQWKKRWRSRQRHRWCTWNWWSAVSLMLGAVFAHLQRARWGCRKSNLTDTVISPAFTVLAWQRQGSSHRGLLRRKLRWWRSSIRSF